MTSDPNSLDIKSLFLKAIEKAFSEGCTSMPFSSESLMPYSECIQKAIVGNSLPDVVLDDLVEELAECLFDIWDRSETISDVLPDFDEFELDVSRCVGAITG